MIACVGQNAATGVPSPDRLQARALLMSAQVAIIGRPIGLATRRDLGGRPHDPQLAELAETTLNICIPRPIPDDQCMNEHHWLKVAPAPSHMNHA